MNSGIAYRLLHQRLVKGRVLGNGVLGRDRRGKEELGTDLCETLLPELSDIAGIHERLRSHDRDKITKVTRR